MWIWSKRWILSKKEFWVKTNFEKEWIFSIKWILWLFKKCEFLSRGELCDLNSEKMLIWSVVQSSDFARSTPNNIEVIYVKTVSQETVFGLLSKNKSRHHPPWLMTCDFCHIFCQDYCRSSKISKISVLTSMLNFTPIHER